MSVSGVIGSDVCAQFAAALCTAARAPGSTTSAANAINKLRLTHEAWRRLVSDPLRRWRGVVRIDGRRRTFLLDDRPASSVAAPRIAAWRPVVRARAASQAPVAGAEPFPPEHRKEQTHEADREQDPADDVDVDGRAGMLVHRKREHGADRDQDEADGQAHAILMAVARRAETFRERARPGGGSCPAVAGTPRARGR